VYNGNVIEIRNIQKVLGGKTVLDIPGLKVGAGEIAGVFGLEDSGRDALFDLLIGRIRPTLGTVRLAGVDPAQARGRFSRLSGIMFSEDALYKNLPVRANLEFQSDLYGLPKQRVDEVMALVGLADQANANADKIPPGLKRRLAFGRVILHRPKVLILEELFARCDESTIMLLENLVRDAAEGGAAVLLMASTSARLAPLCFRIYEIQQGRLLETRLESEQPGRQAFKLPVKLEDKVVLLNPAEILYADAGEGRVNLVTLEGRLPTQYTLAELEGKLSRSGFFRAHRSILVNLQHVKEVIPYTRNSFSIRLDDSEGTKIPLSKSAAAELRVFFGY
jgi:ABC-2 type transport system ATP-binding protein